MREGYLKNVSILPKLPSNIPSIHRHKLSLDMSLVSVPNKYIDISFPSQRNSQETYTSRSKKHISSNASSFLNPQMLTKSYKRYIPGLVEKQRAFPITGNEAIKQMTDSLSEFELRELIGVGEVYFIGDFKQKIHGSLHELNWGYDDNEANYKIIAGDHLAYRYEILSKLGSGSFGQVCKCLDHKTSELVAIKILKNKNKFHKQGAIEVKIVKTLNNSSNVVKFISNFVFRSHLCVVFELLHISLFDFMKRNHFRGLPMSLITSIASQILVALKITNELSIIHCDLKPENILFVAPNNLQIKLIDFGSGCFESRQIYTYIQSRFYRSPEVMLGIAYTPAIDMWSLGCILVELYNGYPLFPGRNEEDQMSKILEVLGPPGKALLARASRKLNFFDAFGIPLPVVDSKGYIRLAGNSSLKRVIGDEESFIEFIGLCLKWDPDERITPEQALKHQWLNTHKLI